MNVSNSAKRHWYLVYCKSRLELSAKINLERQGYEVYLPMIHRSKRFRGNKLSENEPMFPRYIFIHLAKGLDNLAPIRSTIGVAHIIKFGLKLAKVPDSLIALLKERANEQGVFEVKKRDLVPGDCLRVTEGVMVGYEGIVVARSGKERVKLLINVMNCREFNIEISTDQLELVS